ncbi:P-loop containing nucleoside triphosphate hydrolase protein [Dimargaris cristalligena]|uniref:RNA helicase n=1 Tax=Dimargaris cristalligena TaxID=215637 RepID=A0A4P9ZT04_9FUNG|nr:P-loop containing nucleoside triphosphate hydrolase protein [Dimargaris cristalligena]|eukprot:RKP36565.1 P-loop containing nucleoside triphosphate hydrolase protein [Dimargaris cristalligena]
MDFFGSKASKRPHSTDALGSGASDNENGEDESEEEDDDEDNASTSGSDSEDDHQEGEEGFVDEAAVTQFRTRHRIHLYGGERVAHPIRSFRPLLDLLAPALRRNFAAQSGFRRPTPIQMQAIPLVLADTDLVACAPTGSGKTLAYVLPLLHKLGTPNPMGGYRVCIVTPTRELATQVHELFSVLATGMEFRINHMVKSRPTESDTTEEAHTFDILIATPMRLVTEIKNKTIDLSQVQHLVLDEADQLLELGYLEQMDTIIAACPHAQLRKQLFSATIPPPIEELAQSIMRDPVRIFIGDRNAATDTIDQKLVFVGTEEGKLIEIRQMIQRGFRPPVLIFVQSIERSRELFHELQYDGVNVEVIHSERPKAQRDTIVANFRAGHVWVLIATELMARGIDFKGVNAVINYDFPQTVQSYIHRVGRTGRAGRRGEAITYFTKSDAPFLRLVVNIIRDSGGEVPEWMLELKAPNSKLVRNLKQMPRCRLPIKTDPGYMKFKTRQIE